MEAQVSQIVTDTCFWKDLDAGEIIFKPFELHFNWAVTNYIANELTKWLPKFVDNLYTKGLLKLDMDGLLVNKIFILNEKQYQLRGRKRLSPADLSCLVIAESARITLVTSEKELTYRARKLGINVRGTLWVLDQMVEVENVLEPSSGVRAIKMMLEEKRRLPKAECKRRIKKWSN